MKMFDPKIVVSLFDLYFMVQCFWHIFKTMGYMMIMLWHYKAVRPRYFSPKIKVTVIYISWFSDLALYFQHNESM